jgi:hypothetical protein
METKDLRNIYHKQDWNFQNSSYLSSGKQYKA